MIQSLEVHYPLHIFSPEYENRDWRTAAKKSKDLVTISETKAYMEEARAQDQEDVWLYENWFYGMKNGVIMESGALDGLLFSTSYMFETFANWTAVHVGQFIINFSYISVLSIQSFSRL